MLYSIHKREYTLFLSSFFSFLNFLVMHIWNRSFIGQQHLMKKQINNIKISILRQDHNMVKYSQNTIQKTYNQLTDNKFRELRMLPHKHPWQGEANGVSLISLFIVASIHRTILHPVGTMRLHVCLIRKSVNCNACGLIG